MPRKSRDEKRLQRNRVMIGLFIIVIMVMSAFAIVADSMGGSSVTDWGIKLQERDEFPYYRAKIGGQHHVFYSLPSEAYRVPMDESVPSLLTGADYVVFSFDSEMAYEAFQVIELLRYEFDELYSHPVFLAVKDVNQAYNLPVYSCVNATAQTPVVEFIFEQGENEVVREGDCVVVRGDMYGFLRARDRILYSTLGVYSEG